MAVRVNMVLKKFRHACRLLGSFAECMGGGLVKKHGHCILRFNVVSVNTLQKGWALAYFPVVQKGLWKNVQYMGMAL